METSSVPQSVDFQRWLTSDHIDQWLAEDFLRFRWWALIFILAACAFAWWKLLDKSRLKETVLFTAVGFIVVLGINEYGQELILWDYPTDVIPIFPPLSSVNLIMLPFLYSLVFQRFSSFRPYLWATLAVTAIFCFVVEPLLTLGGFFQLLNWRYWMSFPLYVIMALLVRLLSVKALRITAKNRAAKEQ